MMIAVMFGGKRERLPNGEVLGQGGTLWAFALAGTGALD